MNSMNIDLTNFDVDHIVLRPKSPSQVPGSLPGPGPTPTPIPTPLPMPASGPDTTTTGVLRDGFLDLDAVGLPVITRLDTMGQLFGYVPTLDGMPRWNFSQRWHGYVRAPITGSLRLGAAMKSGGWLRWDGTVLIEQDREIDPGGHAQYQATADVMVTQGQWYAIEVVHNVQPGAGEQICEITWQLAPPLPGVPIPITACAPPVGWQSQLKTYTPPPPPPSPIAVVDWTNYQSPAITLPLPSDSLWLRLTNNRPLHPRTSIFVAALQGMGVTHLHPMFGQGSNGIPVQIIPKGTPRVPVNFEVPSESDAGPYPIPLPPVVEPGQDSHWTGLSVEENTVYEIFSLSYSGGWQGYAGAIWDLTKNQQRPLGWTSADAGGLPILPGLLRPEEVLSGRVNHKVRLTVPRTRKGVFLPPANHWASNYPDDDRFLPMGAVIRLNSNYDVSWMSPQARVIAQGLIEFGGVIADNGAFGVCGVPSKDWDDNDLAGIKSIPMSAFEVEDFADTDLVAG